MKNISLILIVLTIAFFNVSCDKTYKGKADFKGVLMYKCGSNDPMGNVTVSLTAGATLLSATTDANGFFHINGPYEYTTRKEISPRLEITSNGQNGGGFGSIILLEDAPDTFNDTIYINNSTHAILTIDTDNSSYGSDADTLFVEYRDMSSSTGSKLVTVVYLGPFTDGQILDTITSRTAPHIGFDMSSPYQNLGNAWINDQQSFTNPPYPFIEEQPNNACGEYTDVYIKL